MGDMMYVRLIRMTDAIFIFIEGLEAALKRFITFLFGFLKPNLQQEHLNIPAHPLVDANNMETPISFWRP